MLHTFVFDRKTIYKNQRLIIYITNDEFQVTYISVEKYFIKQSSKHLKML